MPCEDYTAIQVSPPYVEEDFVQAQASMPASEAPSLSPDFGLHERQHEQSEQRLDEQQGAHLHHLDIWTCALPAVNSAPDVAPDSPAGYPSPQQSPTWGSPEEAMPERYARYPSPPNSPEWGNREASPEGPERRAVSRSCSRSPIRFAASRSCSRSCSRNRACMAVCRRRLRDHVCTAAPRSPSRSPAWESPARAGANSPAAYSVESPAWQSPSRSASTPKLRSPDRMPWRSSSRAVDSSLDPDSPPMSWQSPPSGSASRSPTPGLTSPDRMPWHSPSRAVDSSLDRDSPPTSRHRSPNEQPGPLVWHSPAQYATSSPRFLRSRMRVATLWCPPQSGLKRAAGSSPALSPAAEEEEHHEDGGKKHHLGNMSVHGETLSAEEERSSYCLPSKGKEQEEMLGAANADRAC